jgi:hypothetical protein
VFYRERVKVLSYGKGRVFYSERVKVLSYRSSRNLCGSSELINISKGQEKYTVATHKPVNDANGVNLRRKNSHYEDTWWTRTQ